MSGWRGTPATVSSPPLHKWHTPERCERYEVGVAVSNPQPGSCLGISNRTVDESREAQASWESHVDLQWYKNLQVTTSILDSSLGVWLSLGSLCNMNDRMGKKSVCL